MRGFRNNPIIGELQAKSGQDPAIQAAGVGRKQQGNTEFQRIQALLRRSTGALVLGKFRILECFPGRASARLREIPVLPWVSPKSGRLLFPPMCYYFRRICLSGGVPGFKSRKRPVPCADRNQTRSDSNPVRTYYKLAALFIIAVLFAGYCVAQTKGQATGQTQATQQKPPTAPPATPPAQTAKPPAKAADQEEPIPPAGPNAIYPAVVARVNGKAILGRDLEQRVRAELSSIGSPAWKDLRDDYKNEVTSRQMVQLLSDELLYQKAVASGYVATPAEVQAEFDKIAKSYTSDAALNTDLANRGMDRAALNRELSKNLIVQKFIEENVTKKLTVTPAEVTDYYSKHTDEFKHADIIRTSHILIMVPDGATPEQISALKQRADGLAERAKKGEDFAKLAKENSMDASASKGGDIGLTQDGDLAPEYEAAVAKLKVGEVTGVVKTQFGFHVIKLTDRKKAGTATLDEVRTELTDFLKTQKEDDEVDKLVKTLQSQAKIEILIKF
jgi:peptidyl-prolyl cis-trans isomerase C